MRILPDEISAPFPVEIVGAGSTRSCFYRSKGKPAFDFFLALAIMPFIAPVIVLLYALTRLDGGPGFFGHTRIGRNGRAFTCWKIRTMVQDSAEVLGRLMAENPAAAAEWERDFKLNNDPRVTRLGRRLRSSSLDELPQLWNVLCGEMSFVGPRPVTAAELPRYSGFEKCYLSVRPGITGIWQVSGRNSLSYDQRVKLDASYVDSMSFTADAAIIIKTAIVVVLRNGK